MKNSLSLVIAFLVTTLAVNATRPMKRTITLSDGTVVVLEHKDHACRSSQVAYNPYGVNLLSFDTNQESGLGIYGRSAKGVLPSVGDIEIPVIMAAYQDVQFQKTTTREKLHRMFNEEGYNDIDAPDGIATRGSVRDYFMQNSSGLFRVRFTIVDSVTLSHERAYYGRNSGGGSDSNASGMVNEAISLAQANGADFSPYYIDGKVPLIFIYYAGAGEHASFEAGASNYIWPHFLDSSRSVGGVTFRSYFVGCELLNNYKAAEDYAQTGNVEIVNSGLNGCGVFVHEVSHALGLPDEYDTKYQTPLRESPNYWSVMDYGQYQENSYRPMPYSAYERCVLGWLDLKPLPTEGFHTMHEGDAYIVNDPDNRNQYYIMEPRVPSTWYRHERFGCGLLLWKIKYVQSYWTSNTPNNRLDEQCIHVVPADGVWQDHENKKAWADFRNDLYPGDSQVAESQTHTELELYGIPMFRISYADGAVSFYTGTDGVEHSVLQPQTVNSQKVELNPWISIVNGHKYLNRK